MRVKLLFFVGLGVGYVLGARAGRPRFEQIKARATEAWEDRRVQKVVSETQNFVKENAPIAQEKVIAGSKAAFAGAQQSALRASEIAKDVSERVVDSTKDVSTKVAETARGVSGKFAETTHVVSDRVTQSSKKASKKAKVASRKVAKAAQDASATVTKKAKVVRDRIVDRGEGVVEGVIISAGQARDGALDFEPDDES